MPPTEASPPAADTSVFVDVLTDEELSVVARPGPMPVMPFLDDLPGHERDVARRTAYRSLLARGILDPPTPAAIAEAARVRDGSVDLGVRQDVASVVALREGAEVVVAVARTVATGQDFWYAHLVRDVVLLEEVSSDGLHRFALQHDTALVETAVAAAVHPRAGDAPGDPVPMTAPAGDPTPPDAVLERLGAAFVRADVVVRRVQDEVPPAFTVFSGPDGCWVVAAAAALHDAPLVATPVTAADARAHVADTVSGVRAEARALRG